MPAIRPVLFVLATTVAIFPAFAGDLPTAVAPKGDLPLRDSPPGTFFKSKGDQIGVARQNETLRVIDKKTVPTILGSEEWLKVQSVGEPGKEGWIYSGPADAKASNVAPAPAQ